MQDRSSDHTSSSSDVPGSAEPSAVGLSSASSGDAAQATLTSGGADTEVLEVDVSTVEAALAAAAPVERRLHSDPHDFAGLYIRHRSSFTLHARRYLRDGRDADEVVQEAFLRLFLALPELETELQALAYCRRTITNLCIDRYRAQARRPSLVDLDSVSPEDLADDEPADPVVQAEDAAMVREAMALLSPLHRAALVKREIEEKPLPLIAAELDIPEESVKHLLFRARRALRRLLAGTSLAPGHDDEVAGGLARAAKVGSGGMAGFLLVLALSLGTGPDLRAIPVVGTDLPDLIPVTSPATDKAAGMAAAVATDVASGVADAVTKAVTGVTGAVRSATDGVRPPDEAVVPGPVGPAGAGDPVPVPQRFPASTPGSTPASGGAAPGGVLPGPVPPVLPQAPVTGKTGGEVAPGVSPAPGSEPSASGVPTPNGSAGPVVGGAKETSGGKSSAGAKVVPPASQDDLQPVPAPAGPTVEEPASSGGPLTGPPPPPAVPAPAVPDGAPAAPGAPVAPVATGPIAPVELLDRTLTRAERKAAKKLSRSGSLLPRLSRTAPVLVRDLSASVAPSPTSTGQPTP